MKPIETLYVIRTGLHSLQLFRETLSVQPLDAANAETYAAELEKRCTQDAATMKRTLEEAHERERDRWAQDVRQKSEQAMEYRLRSAALEQELASARERTQLLVQTAVAEARLQHQSQSEQSRSAEARALKEANDAQQRSIQQLISEINTLKQTVSVNKSNEQGKSGENFFEELAEAAFRDFVPHFSLANTAGAAHSGDFHLKGDSLAVMVDCKKYKASKVGREERQKLKEDLERHSHIKVGWMVCLNQPFANAHSSLPFSFEFDGDICICYINSLESYGDNAQKIQLLRTVWTLSALLCAKLLQRSSDSVEMDDMRRKGASIELQVHNLIRSKKELTSVIRQMRTLSEKQDADLTQLLLTLTKEPAATPWTETCVPWFAHEVPRTKSYSVGSLHKMFRKKCDQDVKLADFKSFVQSQPTVMVVEDPLVANFIVRHAYV